jgi:hypothetical protein
LSKIANVRTVSTYTVALEQGHECEAMVRKVYAHLGAIPHRPEIVECRVEQHLARFGDRLQRLGLARAITLERAVRWRLVPRRVTLFFEPLYPRCMVVS